MIRRKSREEILNTMLQGIVQETGITMVGQGSVTRGLASANAGAISEVWQSLEDAVTNSQLSTAAGFYLDLIGETFGLARLQAQPASVSPEDRVIKLSVRQGYLVDRFPHPTNSSLGRIPIGTQVRNAQGTTFTTDQDYDFPAASRVTYVGGISGSNGSNQNVGVGSLTLNDVTGVTSTNVAAVNTGRDVESDDEYRFRLSRWVTSAAGRNATSIRLAVLSAPGVADMIEQPYHAGAGSFKIIVIPTGNRVPAGSLRIIRAALRRAVSEGTFFQVEPPRYLSISISVRLIPQRGSVITATDKDLAEQAALRYIGNVRPGKSLIMNQLRSAILGSARNIGDLRIQALSINGRPMAITNYTLRPDEIFIPDENLDDPILVV